MLCIAAVLAMVLLGLLGFPPSSLTWADDRADSTEQGDAVASVETGAKGIPLNANLAYYLDHSVIQLSPDGKRLYVFSEVDHEKDESGVPRRSQQLFVINTANNRLLRTVDLGDQQGSSAAFGQISESPGGERVYVCANAMYQIDVGTGSVTTMGDFPIPYGCTTSMDGGSLFASRRVSDATGQSAELGMWSVDMYDTKNSEFAQSIDFSTQYWVLPVTTSPDGTALYVVSHGPDDEHDKLQVVTLADGSIRAVSDLFSCTRNDIKTANGKLFAARPDGGVVIVDLKSAQVESLSANIAVGQVSEGFFVSDDGSIVVANRENNAQAFNIDDHTKIGSLPAHIGALSGDGTLAFTAQNIGDVPSVSAVGVKSGREIGLAVTGAAAETRPVYFAMVASRDGNTLYALCADSVLALNTGKAAGRVRSTQSQTQSQTNDDATKNSETNATDSRMGSGRYAIVWVTMGLLVVVCAVGAIALGRAKETPKHRHS
jgi:hypothetical protein